jgi:hypothetical protein
MLPCACQNDYLLYWQQGKKTKRDDGKKTNFFQNTDDYRFKSSTLGLNDWSKKSSEKGMRRGPTSPSPSS